MRTASPSGKQFPLQLGDQTAVAPADKGGDPFGASLSAAMCKEPSDVTALRRNMHRLMQRLEQAEKTVVSLQQALISNRRIGMAVGILMTRHQLTENQAFEVLQHTSNTSNTKLRDVAEQVIYTGTA